MVNLKRIVVTGAAGYIGANVCVQLVDAGYEVIGVDRDWNALSQLNLPINRYAYDVCSSKLDDVFWRNGYVDACIHLAADISVPESMSDPLKYYYNNSFGSLNLLQSCVLHGVPRLILSSTAAVYGEGSEAGCKETDILLPVNPYGKSKHIVETMMFDAAIPTGIQVCALRYFNVVGNDPKQRVRDIKWRSKTNLFPACMKSIMEETGPITIHGKDYSTEDGTALRDYIHVTDLVNAHLMALESGLTGAYNVGTGKCYSVQQVVDEFVKQTGKLKWQYGARRSGDPAMLFAITDKIRHMGWTPQFSLQDMVADYIGMIGDSV